MEQNKEGTQIKEILDLNQSTIYKPLQWGVLLIFLGSFMHVKYLTVIIMFLGFSMVLISLDQMRVKSKYFTYAFMIHLVNFILYAGIYCMVKVLDNQLFIFNEYTSIIISIIRLLLMSITLLFINQGFKECLKTMNPNQVKDRLKVSTLCYAAVYLIGYISDIIKNIRNVGAFDLVGEAWKGDTKAIASSIVLFIVSFAIISLFAIPQIMIVLGIRSYAKDMYYTNYLLENEFRKRGFLLSAILGVIMCLTLILSYFLVA